MADWLAALTRSATASVATSWAVIDRRELARRQIASDRLLLRRQPREALLALLNLGSAA